MTRNNDAVSEKPSVRDACIAEALRVIDEDGVEKLSLREVARRLGLSHQAPYKHFPSRDHILAEVVAHCFRDFANYLDTRPRTGDAHDDMRSMGIRYIEFALANPAKYRLMFNTPLPPMAAHQEMMAEARHAFDLVTEGLSRFPADEVAVGDRASVERDALFIWAAVHGIVSIFQSDSVATLRLEPGVMDTAIPHILGRMSRAFDAGPMGPDNIDRQDGKDPEPE